MIEYRIVYRWIPKFGTIREKQKIYKTEKGARRFYNRITSNNGVFMKGEEGWNGEDHGIFYEKWQLDYARLQTREVGEWHDTI